MTYELAKQLKDAGFPQKFQKGDGFIKPDGTIVADYPEVYRHKDDCYLPTLSELIEKTQNELVKKIGYGFSFWVGHSAMADSCECKASKPRVKNEEDSFYSRGITPEEAVANLWLKLREK